MRFKEPRDEDSNFAIAAAKLHVLNLEPIKLRLGHKWPRLSDLVHALFEKALQQKQGPLDDFVGVGELAYVATFHGRTTEQAGEICASIAKEVCELLFGDGAGDISVRSLVGMVPASLARAPMQSREMADILELIGEESVITKVEEQDVQFVSNIGLTLGKVAALPKNKNFKTALFPIWDLQKRTSSFVALSPMSKAAARPTSYRRLDPEGSEQEIANLELGILRNAGMYTLRVQKASKVCAVAAGVSWEGLCSTALRNRYIAVLREIPAALNCPLMVKIEDVPPGAQTVRLLEIVTTLGASGARVLVEFASDIRIPDLDRKLGAAGIGTTLPEGCSVEKGREIIGMLKRRVACQNAFSFIGGLENRGLLALAEESKIRFGMGAVLEGRRVGSLEVVPDFPLRMQLAAPA